MWASRQQVAGLAAQVAHVERVLSGVENLTGVMLDTLDELRRIENRLRMRDVRAGLKNGNGGHQDHAPDLDRAVASRKGLFPGG